MELPELPGLRGCRRNCVGEQLARKNMRHSVAVINDGQWAILRPKEDNSKEKVVDLLYSDPDLAWIYPRVHRRRQMRPTPWREGASGGSIQCQGNNHTLQGNDTRFAVESRRRKGKPPLFNQDQGPPFMHWSLE